MKKLKLISMILAVLMVVSMLPLAGMFSAFAAEQPEADPEWYERETTDATPYELEINNVNELFAFAMKLNEGTSTAPAFLVLEADPNNPGRKIEKRLTVKLNVDIFLNDGWDAISAKKSEDITAPGVVYPLKGKTFFGGIFDGQGHVLSGLYVDVKSTYVGLFGNIATGYTATVKNVVIQNSFVQSSGEAVGAIFGGIYDQAWKSDDARNGFKTEGIIENVFVEASISSTGAGRTSLGAGGLVGGSKADLTINNAAFIGNVFGGVRGAAAVIGQARGYVATGTHGSYLPSPTKTVAKNIYTQAYVVGSNYVEYQDKPDSQQPFAGGLVGYANNASDAFEFENVICNNTFGTEWLKEDGTEYLYSSQSKDSNGQIVDEHNELYFRTGYLYGGNLGATHKSNDVPATIKDAAGNDIPNPAVQSIAQSWKLTNVYYVKTTHKIKYQTAVGNLLPGTLYNINGVTLDYSYDKTTGVGPMFSFKDYDPAKKLSEMETDIAEISYWGIPRVNMAGKQLYAHGGEYQSQLAMNYFNDNCSLEKDAPEDWEATLESDAKLTGWVVWNDMPLPEVLVDMMDNNEAAEKPGKTPAPDTNWYENQIADATPDELVVYNADDLLAFAKAINDGTTFAGKTVKLAASVTLNEGWNAFAETVTAPATVWPLTTANKSFAGTFDGQGKTISGVYLKTTGIGVGIFGNVYSNTKATIKNVSVVNSYVENNDFAVGGIIGLVHGELVNGQQIADANNTEGKKGAHIGNTCVTLDTIYADINVSSTGKGNGNWGAGGFIGGVSSDAVIKNSVFVGSVQGGKRGIGGAIGSVYQRTATAANDTKSGTNANMNGHFRGEIVIENVMVDAKKIHVIDGGRGHAGGFIGYLNGSNNDITLKNSVCFSTPTEGANVENKNYLGSILGGCYSSATGGTEGIAGELTYWTIDNVYYTSELRPFVGKGMKYTINGTAIPFDATADGSLAAANKALPKVEAAEINGKVKTLEGWTLANGTVLPTTVFNSFFTGFVGQSVTLTKNLSLNIYLKTDGAASIYDATFTLGEDAEPIVVTSVAVGSNTFKFTLGDIAPWQMGETITFTCGEYTATTSVKDYLVILMDENADLAAAMLRWGAASQTVEEYKTDALVTAGLTLPAEKDTTAGLVNDATKTGTESKDNYIKGVRMFVEDGVLKIEAKVFMKDASGLQGLSVQIEGREDTYLNYQELTIYELENRTYTVIFSNVDISNADDAITMTIMKNSYSGDALSQTLTTDLDDLTKDFLAGDATDAEKALVKAMHAVGAALAE